MLLHVILLFAKRIKRQKMTNSKTSNAEGKTSKCLTWHSHDLKSVHVLFIHQPMTSTIKLWASTSESNSYWSSQLAGSPSLGPPSTQSCLHTVGVWLFPFVTGSFTCVMFCTDQNETSKRCPKHLNLASAAFPPTRSHAMKANNSSPVFMIIKWVISNAAVVYEWMAN